MIVFDLLCPSGHRFEGWFASSAEYANQQERALVACPHCGSTEIDKAPMAPAVPKKGNQKPSQSAKSHVPSIPDTPNSQGNAPSPDVLAHMAKLATLQAEVLKNSRWVGDRLVEESRAMHYGDRETQAIHGQATFQQAKELHEEGIPVAPLLFPVAPPKAMN